MSDEVREKVLEIIAAQAMVEPSELSLEMSPQEIGLDSLALVESIFAIEERFDINVPFNANEPESGSFDISSLGAIVAAVEKLVADQAA